MKNLQHIQRGHADRRGAALIMSLVAVMVIASLGAGLVQLQSIMSRKQAFAMDKRRALYIAEAGIAESALAVSQGKSGVIASENVPALYGGGVFWVDTVDLPDDRISLVCTAQVGGAEFVLRTMVVPNVNPVASLGFFGADGVTIGWGTVADGFHSGRGTFDSQLVTGYAVPTTGDHADIGSNADIVLEETVASAAGSGEGESGDGSGGGRGGSAAPQERATTTDPGDTTGDGTTEAGKDDPDWSELLAEVESKDPETTSRGATPEDSPLETPPVIVESPAGDPTRLFGRVRPGPSNVVTSSGFSELYGSIDDNDHPVKLPPVALPTCDEVLTTAMVIAADQTGIGSERDTRVAGLVSISTGATLTLEGPAILDVDVLAVQTGATLILDDSLGPIEIYVRTGAVFAEGSTLQTVGDTSHSSSRGVSLFVKESSGSSNRLHIHASGTFHGLIYAPSDVVRLPKSLRFYGAAAGRILETEPGARISYDRRLAIGGDAVPTLPRILSWQVVPVGDGTARALTMEPILALKLRGVTPVPSSTASPESTVEIQYIDTGGSRATYTGPITGFNPASSSRVVGMRWDDPRDGTPRRWLLPAGEDPRNTIEDDRQTVRSMRELIQSVSAGANVGMMTDPEVVNLMTALPDAVVEQAPEDVQMAEDLMGGVNVEGDAAADAFDPDAWVDDTPILQRCIDLAATAAATGNNATRAMNAALGFDTVAAAQDMALKAREFAAQSAAAARSALMLAETAPAPDLTEARNHAQTAKNSGIQAENNARAAENHVNNLATIEGTEPPF